MRRTQELEEMITQQNNTIMTMLSGGKGKDEKSQVNLSVDFISGKRMNGHFNELKNLKLISI